MSLVKKYDYNATREAIERADGRCINTLKMVRSDISVVDWGKQSIKPKHRDKSLVEELRWPGHRDVGHTFRHVEASAEAGKSVYVDAHTAISVTMQVLNSMAGQEALKNLATQNRSLYDNATQRVSALIAGEWYGKSAVGGSRKRILEARCELLNLGSQLWVHSTYPRKFFNSVADLAQNFGG